MVRIWPWKGEDNSPASFEKALSSLATKISKSQTQLDALRQRGRRAKALWTLYTSFAYLLCFIILFLVVGWRNWTALEYTAVAGSPLIIWLIRTGITTYYTYRVDTVSQRLEAQQAERTKTIDKLKAATKYNSTQELLEKYGGEKPKPKPKRERAASPKPKNAPRASSRTSIGPPPTANIQRPGQQIQSQPSTPQPQHIARMPPPTYNVPSPISPESATSPISHAEFAPNAFSAPPQYANASELNAGGNWYDRVLDILLGEDETLPKNRLALICENCRLVNGQAPPGTRSLADLGKWRCFGCGAMNGEEDEAVKVVKEMKERIEDDAVSSATESKAIESERENDAEGAESKDDEAESEPVDEGSNSASDTISVKPRRGRPKSTRKKA